MSSLSIGSSSNPFHIKFTPPIFQDNPTEGKSGIFFFVNGRLIHNEIIDVTRVEKETRTLYTTTGRVRKLSIKTTLEMVSKEIVGECDLYDQEQIERATETALSKLAVHKA